MTMLITVIIDTNKTGGVMTSQVQKLTAAPDQKKNTNMI